MGKNSDKNPYIHTYSTYIHYLSMLILVQGGGTDRNVFPNYTYEPLGSGIQCSEQSTHIVEKDCIKLLQAMRNRMGQNVHSISRVSPQKAGLRMELQYTPMQGSTNNVQYFAHKGYHVHIQTHMHSHQFSSSLQRYHHHLDWTQGLIQ